MFFFFKLLLVLCCILYLSSLGFQMAHSLSVGKKRWRSRWHCSHSRFCAVFQCGLRHCFCSQKVALIVAAPNSHSVSIGLKDRALEEGASVAASVPTDVCFGLSLVCSRWHSSQNHSSSFMLILDLIWKITITKMAHVSKVLIFF